MTDASGLTPEQEAVRRLLATARHDGPPPPAVVDRLDETLASLVAERGSGPLVTDEDTDEVTDVAPVVDLGARRRRMAGIGVLAAAAVVVAGVAVGQVLPRGANDSTGGSDAASQAESSTFAEAPADGGADSGTEDDSGAGSSELAPEAMKSSAAAPEAGYPSLAAADPQLDQQVLDLRGDATTRTQDLATFEALGTCALPRLGPGRRVLVQVDGEPGIVVFRRAEAATQQAEVYSCGTPDPVRTLTLPAP